MNFGQSDTASTIASKIASALTADTSDPVTGTASGAAVTLKTRQTGASVNYSLTTSVSYDTTDFSQSSFAASPSGTALTGGSAGNGTPVYDSGTVSLTVNGANQTVNYANGDTASSIASKLASAFSINASVTVSASGAALIVAAKTSGASTNYSYSSSTTYSTANFSAPSFGISPTGGSLSGGADQSYNPATVYGYNIPASGGYDKNGNLLSVNDSVMGQWGYTYDNLNRLATGHATSGTYNAQYGCWTYDNFGNRLNDAVSTTPCTSSPTPTFWAHYNTNNQFTGTALKTSISVGNGYDAAGNITDDGAYLYLIDVENRVCAVKNTTTGALTQYIYDAEGGRVAKGTISAFNCNRASNGFALTNSYVLGLNGEQVTEFDGGGHWYHSNVYAGSKLLATYGGSSTYFALSDWLGTKRVETTPDGVAVASYLSLPFGDGFASIGSGPDATEHHFTGKIRDTESGNDYFGARYYSSTAARFMSPDWATKPEAVPYSDLTDPQSLNLYGYVRNNPLSQVDDDGHGIGASFWPLGLERFPAVIPVPVSPSGALPLPLPPIQPLTQEQTSAVMQTINSLSQALQDSLSAAENLLSGMSAGTAPGPYVGPIMNEGANSDSNNGPKASDAPGITAGGQATDQHGRKLGPSGKPQINETNSNTREQAGNRALDEGAGKVEHANPKRGQPHFHPTDAQGNKKPGSTHHNYPDN